MAALTFDDGKCIGEFDEVVGALAPLGIRLERWPVGDDATIRALLARPTLDSAEKDQVSAYYDRYFEPLKAAGGCEARDLIVLHGDIEDLDAIVAKYHRCHVHSDDELRYILDGEGVFGVVLPDGGQVELHVEAGEYIAVPQGVEHWFRLTEARRVKSMRYFTATAGWQADFTDTPIRFA